MAPVSFDRVRQIHDLDSLIGFLRDELEWLAPDNLSVEEMAYDYRADELRLDAVTADHVRVRQLAPFVPGQPWGIFLVEMNTAKVYATHLRKILRGLAPSARQRSSDLKAWNAQNILFICTTPKFDRFTFAHFKGDKASTATLSTFGWERGDVGIRTLCEYNLPALKWPHEIQTDMFGAPIVDEWTKKWSAAFDVLAVTDKFFKEFRDVFEETKDDLQKVIKSATDRHSFTQRLFNRLLFLCFLQKKRWLREPSSEHPSAIYLFDLFDFAKAQGTEFYSDFLHILFFNALNRPRTSYSQKEIDHLTIQIGAVPFLNGGLFDPTDKWDSEGAISLPNKLFERILGNDGLLRRYNFTVTESTPLNQEVAVDPEMLGKVFETVVLTSEEAADYQAPNLRKATGSFYTPRIVVTFNVREVLQDYITARIPGLDKRKVATLMEMDATIGLNEEVRRELRQLITPKQAETIRDLLRKLRACDPAIGSGAFALGLLHALVNLHLLCETVERNKDPRLGDPNFVFKLKKQIIQENIYGVDLQAKAVEICKLRLWLSMIVDFELDVDPDNCTAAEFERAIGQIPPLPNLVYKIRRGDALLDLVHGKPFRLKEITHNPAMQAARNELSHIHKAFFGEQNPDQKRQLRRDALVHRTRLTRLQLESQRAEIENIAVQSNMFAEKESKAALRKRQEQLDELNAVLAEVKKTEAELEKLSAKKRLMSEDDDLLTELEASSESAQITFCWELDFPEIFDIQRDSDATLKGAMPGIVNQANGQMELTPRESARGGFDAMLGNPPFVTARNAEKRELYRERWRETAFLKFQLVAPFFQRSFGLLATGGHLGFIVANAFAKREFGKPLVENFFPTVDLQKVVDCSGLMFPGHGTPTCIVFGCNRKPSPDSKIRVVATLSGGGDLKTVPENSPLWATIEKHHDQVDYSDPRIMVADRPRTELAKHPWNLDVGAEPTRKQLETQPHRLEELLEGEVGVCTMTNADEIFILPDDQARRLNLPAEYLRLFQEGDEVRDWSLEAAQRILVPYDKNVEIISERKIPAAAMAYLKPFKELLANRLSFGNKTFEELGREWYSFERMNANKYKTPQFITFGEIATHAHFVYWSEPRVFERDSPVIKLPATASADDHHALAGLMSSNAALFWLKQYCFSKRESDEPEADTYFVFGGSKVQQLPIPSTLLKSSAMRDRLIALSRACWERGKQLPARAFKKLFEMPGEAYYEWNSSLTGWVTPSTIAKQGWRDSKGLQTAQNAYIAERERLRREMIALQEEMDWLVYAAYGLLPVNDPAIGNITTPEPLSLGERPFELKRDSKPIPESWSAERRALWQARINAIEANEHIRRIEQPVYKRRWYRKEDDTREFRRAFEWWLMEKAEWWLEKKASSGPVALDTWADALWKDERVRAAVQAIEPGTTSLTAFVKSFKSIVVETTVPDWIPPAMPWDQVEKKFKKVTIPVRAKKIRGKLNVPRERFRTNERGEYVWAGK